MLFDIPKRIYKGDLHLIVCGGEGFFRIYAFIGRCGIVCQRPRGQHRPFIYQKTAQACALHGCRARGLFRFTGQDEAN